MDVILSHTNLNTYKKVQHNNVMCANNQAPYQLFIALLGICGKKACNHTCLCVDTEQDELIKN